MESNPEMIVLLVKPTQCVPSSRVHIGVPFNRLNPTFHLSNQVVDSQSIGGTRVRE